jgi:diacylglycerol kinase family enzyme
VRAILVVNPKATTTSELGRDVLVRALRSEVDLTVAYTRRRGHAAELARLARAEHYDVVVTLGGDGTVNEVVNGLLGDAPSQSGEVADQVPALAVVPGGSANVFARALGLPRDTMEGTGVILDALHSGRVRSIGLGRADGRYFTFCAGFGLDAEVVRKVERARLHGRVSSPALYMRSTASQLIMDTDRRNSMITLDCPGEETQPEVAAVIVQNTAPWTYLGDRPVNVCPDASFDTGLDLLALKALHLPGAVRLLAQMLSTRHNPHGRQILTLHDVPEFTLRALRPLAFQLDGDYLGERSKVTFTAVPQAIRVFC